jgi:hypothetical protein
MERKEGGRRGEKVGRRKWGAGGGKGRGEEGGGRKGGGEERGEGGGSNYSSYFER